MDDREIVAAIAADELAGVAAAYDMYAESLYGYCRWMLGNPDDAAAAIQDTFITAAGQAGALPDPRKLRAWLYAVARNDCHRRSGAVDGGLYETPEPGRPPADVTGGAQLAELRRVVRAALAGLNPDEREILELSLRHELNGADLAAVLGVPRNHALALAARARDRLEDALAVLIVSQTGRRACPVLDMLLTDWDGRLTVVMRRRITRHIRTCETCDSRMREGLRSAALSGMPPLAPLPGGLRDVVLRVCADRDPQAVAYRSEVTHSAGSFLPIGFPEAIHPPGRILSVPRTAIAAGVLVAVAASGTVAALALGGSHPSRSLAADRSSGPAAASSTATASATSARPSAGAPPAASQAASSQPPVVVASVSPTTAKPSSSRPVTAPPTPKPTSPGPGPPFTFTPMPTPRPTPRPTPTTSVSASASPTPTPTTSTSPAPTTSTSSS